MPGSFGWTCAACGYEHGFPGTRCSCCHQLKGATRQEMRDFVMGNKTLPKQNDKVEVTRRAADDDDDDDDVMVIEPPKENLPTFLSTPIGNTAKENQRQPTVFPADDGATITSTSKSTLLMFDANRSSKTTTALPDATRNPYAKRSGPMSVKPHATSRPSSFTASVTRPTAADAADPSTTTTANNDAWQQVSTVSPHALAIHPPAPPRQTPVSTPGIAAPRILEQTPAAQQNAFDTLKRAQQSSMGSKTGPESLSSKKKSPKSPFLDPPKYSPGPVTFDPSTIHNWIYPQSPTYPARQYQHEITATAIQHNTLVSLPTGLGKTLIASVVMYNFYRWFPMGKVIFLAPTLPLVNQQVEACYRIMGIPASDTAVLTGKLSRERRMEHWMARRVFFCTPQTLQNDLVDTESNGEEFPSIFAPQVVCLILDEAHKATGDYAYVKVIEQLEAANARFRIVGLSATPGTTINAIQNVINILRSSHLEARDEDDPVVKRYTHEKHMEIVTVSRSTIQGDVERHITNMLSPYLNKLCQYGAINFKGNASVTAWQIINSRNIFKARNNGQVPGHLLSLYEGARVLATLRHDAHGSLQCLRSKLLPLQNEPQRGVVNAIVKSEEFQQLLQMVNEATDLDAGLSQQQGGFTRNNPKLQKLGDILTEHFKRATAVGKSSRVIVFSQFRDSVAEIVLLLRTLEPMVRPHHFVGQGKPPTGSSKDQQETGTMGDLLRLNGMKQSEQQQVIQEFRNDKYNVLVCTCIGEEGLDIGEVDLIVNYDALKSPIRMIQRMGRTGRARAGRVIVLLAEGDEERAYAQSKANANKLKRALQTKKNLVMVPDVLLFPTPPNERLDMAMNIQPQLRMSQVAGVSEKTARRSNSSKGVKYKLDAAQEQERQQRLGNLKVLDTNVVPWRTLRRVLIRHRSSRQTFGGRTIRILSALQQCSVAATAVDGVNAYKASRVNSAIHEIFPIEKPPEVGIASETSCALPVSTSGDLTHPDSVLLATTVQQHGVTTTSGGDGHQDGVPLKNDDYMSLDHDGASSAPLVGNLPSEQALPRPKFGQVSNFQNTTSEQETYQQALPNFEPLVPNHSNLKPVYSKRNGSTEFASIGSVECCAEVLEAMNTANIPQPMFRLPTPPPSSSEEESDDEQERQSLQDDRAYAHDEGLDESDRHSEAHIESPFASPFAHENGQKIGAANTSFFLPTQSSSSEGEGSSDYEGYGDTRTKVKRIFPHRKQAFDSRSRADQKKHTPSPPLRGKADLVTAHRENQEVYNSSDEDMPLISLRTPRKERDAPLISLRKKRNSNITKKGNQTRKCSAEGAGKNRLEDPSITENACIPAESVQVYTDTASTPSPDIVFARRRKKHLFVEEDDQSHPDLEFQGLQSPLETCAVKNVIQYTPNAFDQRESTTGDNISLACARDAGPGALTDTPLSGANGMISEPAKALVAADDICCEICLSLESMDEDPIILCDGCQLGFHKSCYCIDISIESSEAWYCDQCRCSDTHSCMVCGTNDGALKEYNDDWCHPICKPFSSSAVLSQRQCSYCLTSGGSRCFSCPISIHPFCAINGSHQQRWTVVIVQPHDAAQRPSAALFCPNHVNNANNFISMHMRIDSAAPLPTVQLIQTCQISRSHAVPVAGPKKLKRKRGELVDEKKPSVKEHHVKGEASTREARRENLRRRRQGAAAFVLEEAEVDQDDIVSQDEDQEPEDEESSNDSFINDATELTQHFSQDILAAVDGDAAGEISFSFSHRAMDAQRAIEQLYTTPLLNRRMTRPNESQYSSSSQKGLGNMHFVRSVLEHHRQGGSAEEIERLYREMEQGGMSGENMSQRSPS